MSFVKFEHVKKTYQMGEVTIDALRDASFEIEKGEICVIVGPSGAGKTTLLNILGGMDSLTEGHVYLDGSEISGYSAKELTTYRRHEIGFVFQFYNLVQNLTAVENVSLATQICKNPMDSREALEKVGLAERLNNAIDNLIESHGKSAVADNIEANLEKIAEYAILAAKYKGTSKGNGFVNSPYVIK